MSNLNSAIVLAAGFGKRMNSSTPKVLHPICGVPMLGHVLETVQELKPTQIITVVGHGKERVTNYLNSEFKKVKTVVQKEQKGTGHAVQTALAQMKTSKGLVLITAGDTPLLTSESITRLVLAAKESKAAVLTADLPDPTGYGRVIRLASMVDRIVEQSDATAEELEITEINTGVYVFDIEILKKAITQLKANNKQGEIYLTDVVAVINNMGESVSAVMCDDYLEALGINDRSQLALAQQILQQTINEYWMSQGVSMRNPDSVVIDVNVELGQDVFLDNNTHLLGDTQIGNNSIIGPDTMLKDCVVGTNSHVLRTTAMSAKIGNNCEIGPYTYLRPGTVLKNGVKAGAYV